jgi:hypothetical protein
MSRRADPTKVIKARKKQCVELDGCRPHRRHLPVMQPDPRSTQATAAPAPLPTTGAAATPPHGEAL